MSAKVRDSGLDEKADGTDGSEVKGEGGNGLATAASKEGNHKTLRMKPPGLTADVLIVLGTIVTVVCMVCSGMLVLSYPSENNFQGSFYRGVGHNTGFTCLNGSTNIPHRYLQNETALAVLDPEGTLSSVGDFCETFSAAGFDKSKGATLDFFNFTVLNGWGRERKSFLYLCYQQMDGYSIISTVKLTSDTLAVSSFLTGAEAGTNTGVYGQSRTFYFATDGIEILNAVRHVLINEHSIGDEDLRNIAEPSAIAALSFMTPPTFMMTSLREHPDPVLMLRVFRNRDLNIPSIAFESLGELPATLSFEGIATNCYGGGHFQFDSFHKIVVAWNNTALWEMDTPYWCSLVITGTPSISTSHCTTMEYISDRRLLFNRMKEGTKARAKAWEAEGTPKHHTLWQEINAMQMLQASYSIGSGFSITIGKKQKSILFDGRYEMERSGYDRWCIRFERNSRHDASVEDAQCVYGVSFFDLELDAESNVIALYFQLLALVLFSLFCARSTKVSMLVWCRLHTYTLSTTFATTILTLQVFYLHFVSSSYVSAALTTPSVLVRGTALRILEHYLFPMTLEKLVFGSQTRLTARIAIRVVSSTYILLTLLHTALRLGNSMSTESNYYGSPMVLFNVPELYAVEEAHSRYLTTGAEKGTICNTHDCVDTISVRILTLVAIALPYTLAMMMSNVYDHFTGNIIAHKDTKQVSIRVLETQHTSRTTFEQNCVGVNIPDLIGKRDVEPRVYESISLDIVWTAGYMLSGDLIIRRRDVIVVLVVLYLPVVFSNGIFLSLTLWLITEGKVGRSLHLFTKQNRGTIRRHARNPVRIYKLS